MKTKENIHKYYSEQQSIIDATVASLWAEGVRIRVHSKPPVGRMLKNTTIHGRVKGGKAVREKVRKAFESRGLKIKLFWAIL